MLHPFQQYRLDKEPAEIRRFIWILEMKKSMTPQSQERHWFNIKRDKQVVILKKAGLSRNHLSEIARSYGCILELVED